MSLEGPSLQALTHRLAECPPEFLEEPRVGDAGVIDVAAVVSDLSRDLGGPLLTREQAAPFHPAAKKERNRLRVALVAAWLLHDPWFRGQRRFWAQALDFLVRGPEELSALVEAPRLVADPDRREELVRLCLQALGLRPAGENEAQAADRLSTLSSVERNRVIHETRAAQDRVRKIREAMKKKAAQEAAPAYGRE